MDLKTSLKMNNGLEIPVLGLGTWQTRAGAETVNSVLWALEFGYRHIDTAAIYENEESVGEGIRKSGIPRNEIFVTTKVWNSDQGYDKALRAFDRSIKKLRLDYVDLYLIHWPVEGLRNDTWKALENLQANGKVRSIGVSNYTINHLEELQKESSNLPAVNQVEFHPYLFQKELMEYCNYKNIIIEAYSPLVRGRKFKDPKLIKIADKYGKSPAQILIRWSLQHNLVVLPKSAHKERVIENASVFDFSISNEDMNFLDSFDEVARVCWDPSGII
jgi:methylglyoxal/glyoxal reductase